MDNDDSTSLVDKEKDDERLWCLSASYKEAKKEKEKRILPVRKTALWVLHDSLSVLVLVMKWIQGILINKAKHESFIDYRRQHVSLFIQGSTMIFGSSDDIE